MLIVKIQGADVTKISRKQILVIEILPVLPTATNSRSSFSLGVMTTKTSADTITRIVLSEFAFNHFVVKQ